MTGVERARIAAGIFNVIFPGWEDRLNTEGCDIWDSKDCILARVSQIQYSDALDDMYSAGYPRNTNAFVQTEIEDWNVVIAETKAAKQVASELTLNTIE